MTRAAREAGFLLGCAIAFAGLLLGGSAYAQLFDPQPYLVYHVPPEPVVPTPVVDLEDQFNFWNDVPVLDRSFLMNPAAKWPLDPPGDPELIRDVFLHYRWYVVDIQRPGTRIVQVTNQFAQEEPWEIETAPEFLLAPASKITAPGEPGPPPFGQHYDCYRVANGRPTMAIVQVEDQFGLHTPLDVVEPTYLCAPAEKTREDGTVYPIVEAEDGRDHLACFEVTPEPHDEFINTRDQFTDATPDEGMAEHEVMLCVPSTKIYEKVPSLAPWGVATLGLSMLLAVVWVAQRRVRYGKPA